MILTVDQVQASTGASLAAATAFTPELNSLLPTFGIDGPLRVAAFLAQVGHESGGLHWLTELWGPTLDQLRYDERGDLGNLRDEAKAAAAKHGSTPGRWWCGRGLIQVTGYDNYVRIGTELSLDLVNQPQLLAQPHWAVASACIFWRDEKLNDLADLQQFDEITRRINGGTNGMADRLALYAHAQIALQDVFDVGLA